MTRPADTTASGWFGAMTAGYDSLIRRCVPRYDEMLARLLGYLDSTPSHVVELGCGTGNLALLLAERFPAARLTLVDASPEMLETTRARLVARDPSTAARTTFVEARFEDLDLPDASVDLVTSCISLHHVDDKAALYAHLARALVPGGQLAFADQLRGATDAVHAVNWEAWLAFCRRADGCTVDEVDGLLDHAAAHDHYTPLVEHFRLLDAAGFLELDCVWRNLIWGIVLARRPSLLA